jgi:anti-sigma28 factor (negative regulator of flagellin synthesis)
MQNTGEAKNLADIQKKIESGFYDSDEVLSKVADSILKEIGK